jgi:hypothetical protein
MSKEHSSKTASFSIIGLLGIVFVTLKLCHVIDWSWWWVTVPFWGAGVAVLAILAVVILAALLMNFLDR